MKEEYQDILLKKMRKDTDVLVGFIEIFCSQNHSRETKSHVKAKGRAGEFLKDIAIELCPDCNKLLLHAVSKRILCPYDPKPRCKECPTHCYRPGYREKIREVMRFSGAYSLKRGRLDLVAKYFF